MTDLLTSIQEGDEGAAARLWQLVYGELHAMAERHLGNERGPIAMQPTSVLHETFLRVGGQRTMRFENRAHFFGAAARAMRRILIDNARARVRAKRGGEKDGVRHSATNLAAPVRPVLDLLALDEALDRLEVIAPRKAQIVELRYFAGLTVAAVAEFLDVSVGTVSEEWKVAKMWLLRELGGAEDDGR
ncbi:MAG: sigma-70 family RNA polymerase sigma factor [Planctomycetes bacterium]|nr:sigma-70 family RNA polymerase sigma factor [Planctomycetota bacterium]